MEEGGEYCWTSVGAASAGGWHLIRLKDEIHVRGAKKKKKKRERLCISPDFERDQRKSADAWFLNAVGSESSGLKISLDGWD